MMAKSKEERREQSKQLRLSNKDRYNATRRDKNSTPEAKEERRWRQILYTHHITREQWEDMYEEQNGMCPICHRHMNRKEPHVDHNHITNEVRQLLCPQCNTALGLVYEDLDIIDNMIDYINKWNK